MTILFIGALGLIVGGASASLLRRFDPSWCPVGIPVLLSAGWMGGSIAAANAAFYVFAWWSACLAGIDLGSRRLPNVMTATGAIVVLGYGAAVGDLSRVSVGASALFCSYLLVHLVVPKAFGAGDVKLAFGLGGVSAMAGLDAWVLSSLLAPLLTGAIGLVFLLRGRPGVAVAHGPSMCLATLLALATVPT